MAVSNGGGRAESAEMLDLTQPVDCNTCDNSAAVESASSDVIRHPYAKLDVLSPHVDMFLLVQDRVICGRGQQGVDCRLDRVEVECPQWNNIISKSHFQLDRDHDKNETYITDLSTNGTFKNQMRLQPKRKELICNGDIISLGMPGQIAFVYTEQLNIQYPIQLTSKYIMTNVSLGKGGYGKVILARLRSECQLNFAVKVLDKCRLNSRFSRAISKQDDIRNEVQIMLRLDHPNMIRFVDWIESEHAAFIVLEYVSGGELFERIVDPKFKKQGFGDAMGRFYAYQLLSAVAYLHENGICHRDIKPENILLADSRDYTIAKLTDFGLAKPREASTMKTYCGTPCYIAPEMVDNERSPYSNSIDIWSMGVVLFTMFVGYPPFSADYGDMDLNEQIKRGRLRFLHHWKAISLDTQNAIKRMLRVEAYERGSARELLSLKWMRGAEVTRARQMVKEHRLNQMRKRSQPKRRRVSTPDPTENVDVEQAASSSTPVVEKKTKDKASKSKSGAKLSVKAEKEVSSSSQSADKTLAEPPRIQADSVISDENSADHLTAEELLRLREKRSFNTGDWTSEELKLLYDGIKMYGKNDDALEYIAQKLLTKRTAAETKAKVVEIRGLIDEHRLDRMSSEKEQWIRKGYRDLRPPAQFIVPQSNGGTVTKWLPAVMRVNRAHRGIQNYPVTNALVVSFLDSSPDVVQRVNVSSALTARQRDKESELNWNRVYRFVAAIIANDDTLPGLNPLEASVVISILDDIQNEAVGSMSAEEKAVLKGWLTNIQMADLRDFEPDLPCNRYTAAQVLLDPLRSRLFGCPESGSRLPEAPSASAPCVPGLGGDGDGGEESMDVPMPSHDADTPEPTNEVIML